MSKPNTKIIYGIIGRRLDHSLSPLIHNHFFAEKGISSSYGIFEFEPDDLGAGIEKLRAAGFGGANVTHPYKQSVIPCLDDLEKDAARVGAVNTIKNDAGKLVGYNTDLAGIRASISNYLQLDLRDAEVVLLGAGGAARACLSELCRMQTRRVRVFNRTKETAEKIVANLPEQARRIEVTAHRLSDFQTQIGNHIPHLIINATSSTPAELTAIIRPPARQGVLAASIVWDLNYGRRALSSWSLSGSVRYYDGLYLLAAQAAESFRIWTGQQLEHGIVYRYLKAESTGDTSCCAS